MLPSEEKKTIPPPDTTTSSNAWSKYEAYELDVDPAQDNKALEIRLCSFSRPHMRAFHCSWWSFFIAFFIWFAVGPLLPEIRSDLRLTPKDVWNSSIAGVGSTILVRLLVGPLCDKYGARILFSILLCVAAIPTALTGLVRSSRDLIVLRACIGVAGGTFVTCQYWTSRMFAKEVVGTANALVGGWGNLGAGVTQLLVGSLLFPLYEFLFEEDDDDEEATGAAWRSVCVLPALVGFATGIVIFFISDDSPKGNFHELRERGLMTPVNATRNFVVGSTNPNTWLLFLQYACCFGVELTMNNAAALYFRDVFGQSTEAAGAIASMFGWMNLFARGLGGTVSDLCNYRWGIRGRIIVHTIMLALEGALVLVFANTTSLASSLIILVLFSFFVQAAEGTTYAIVPYVDPPRTGVICGLVGAGGNVGAVCFGLGFRELDYASAFNIMGVSILGSSLLSVLMVIKGHAGIVVGQDRDVDKETGKLIDKQETFGDEETVSP